MLVRRASVPIVAAAGGHATLDPRAGRGARGGRGVFAGASRRSRALTKRVRESFDPQGVLNPGRMWAGV